MQGDNMLGDNMLGDNMLGDNMLGDMCLGSSDGSLYFRRPGPKRPSQQMFRSLRCLPEIIDAARWTA